MFLDVDGEPHLVRALRGQPVESEGREEADDPVLKNGSPSRASPCSAGARTVSRPWAQARAATRPSEHLGRKGGSVRREAAVAAHQVTARPRLGYRGRRAQLDRRRTLPLLRGSRWVSRGGAERDDRKKLVAALARLPHRHRFHLKEGYGKDRRRNPPPSWLPATKHRHLEKGFGTAISECFGDGSRARTPGQVGHGWLVSATHRALGGRVSGVERCVHQDLHEVTPRSAARCGWTLRHGRDTRCHLRTSLRRKVGGGASGTLRAGFDGQLCA
jgi:hypothetical protein